MRRRTSPHTRGSSPILQVSKLWLPEALFSRAYSSPLRSWAGTRTSFLPGAWLKPVRVKPRVAVVSIIHRLGDALAAPVLLQRNLSAGHLHLPTSEARRKGREATWADGFLPPFFWGGYQRALTLEHSDLPNSEVRLGGVWVATASSRVKGLPKKPCHSPRRRDFLGASKVLDTHNLFRSGSTRQGDTHCRCLANG